MSERITTRTVTNPLNESFTFGWASVEYTIPAKSTVALVDYLAVHAAKHLADKLMIHAGRYNDEIKGDKRIYKAVTENEKSVVMEALLDREDDKISLDEIMNKKEVEEQKPENVLPTIQLKASTPVEPEVPVVKPEAPVVPTTVDGDLAKDMARWEQLKGIGFARLQGPEREEYKVLKVKLNQ